MIDRLRVENFKCLRDVAINFAPLTVLIGPNDSGKSSLLDALFLLGQSTRQPLIHHPPPENSVFVRGVGRGPSTEGG